MRRVIAGADQSTLLRPMMDEEHRSLRRLFHKCPRRREDRRADGRVVVGAGVYRVALERPPNTVRVLMRAEDDILVTQLWVGASHHADHIHRRHREPLETNVELRLRCLLYTSDAADERSS